MKFMNEWKEFTDNMFGDFVSDDYRYGIWRNSPSDYFLARFNNHNKKDGISAHRLKDGSVEFAKYENDKMLCPAVTVEKTESWTSGKVFIKLREVDGSFVTLELDTKDSSFRYYLESKGKIVSSFTLDYNGRTGEFSFVQKDKKQLVLPRSFTFEKPIVCFDEIGFEDLSSFEDFTFTSDNEGAIASNDTDDSGGIGCIVWEDQYCIGEWEDKFRSGWQFYQWSDSYQIYHAEKNLESGLSVKVNEANGAVIIRAMSSSDDGESDNSNAIIIYKNTLYLVDYWNDGINFGPQTDSVGIVIPSFDHINFVKWKGECPLWSFEKYELLESFDARLILDNQVSKSGKRVDLDDPELQMMNLIGQKEAKKVFVRLRAYLQKNDAKKSPIHMIFTGGNGVGKTTVAKLITEVLYKYRAIDKNNYLEANAKSLFNNFTGETSNRIDDLYKNGEGGVILIDDFHFINALNSSNIKEGISKISELMHTDTSTTFILVDTKQNMKQVLEDNYDMLSDIIRFRIDFSDFSKDELKQILEKKVIDKGYTITEEALNSLLEVIFLAKSYGNNINASAALSILEEVIVAQNVRCTNSDDKEIVKDDVSYYISENDIAFIDQKTGGQSDARKKLDELVGLEQVKEMIDDLIAYFTINRGKRVDFHMVFTGNPGTGKTEVARIIGKLLRQEGILGSSRFLEVTRSDLIAEFVGQTAIKTRAVIEKAMGGVLYIDEAYSLAYGGERDFGPEAIAELLKAMEDRRGEFCVIMAGYTSEMKKLFDLNPGLKSRVKFDLDFPDYTDEELEKILKLFLKRDNNIMSADNIKLLVKIISSQRKLPNFANVRTLREYLSRVQIKQARRVRQAQLDNTNPNELTYEDIVSAFGKKEIDLIVNGIEAVIVSKLNPSRLIDDYKVLTPLPYLENKEAVGDAVVAIKKEGEKSGESSGFIISSDGYVATCAHCVKDATKLTVRRRLFHRNKKVDIIYNAQIVSLDEKADLAILKLNSEDGEEFDYVELADGKLKLEPLSEVYLLGYPFGVSRFDAMSVNLGRIVSYQKDERGYEQINLDISAKGGNSGSLVLEAKTSNVIGVLVGSSISHNSDFVEEINYCRPVKYLWDLINNEFDKEQKEKKDENLSKSIFESNAFTFSNNKTEFEIEYLEYWEDSKIQIIHQYYTAQELKERHGKNRISIDCGNRNLTISGAINDQYYFSLFKEVYEYSYRKVKDFILDEAHPIFDERIDQSENKAWVRAMIRLIKK